MPGACPSHSVKQCTYGRTYGRTYEHSRNVNLAPNASRGGLQKNVPDEADTPQARTLRGYHWTQSRIPRPSVAREYTHRRSSASERFGNAPRFTAGRTRQMGYLHDPVSGGCKAVVGSQVTRERETYPYPGLELITPAGDAARHPLCFTNQFREQGGSTCVPNASVRDDINGNRIPTPIGTCPDSPESIGWLDEQQSNGGGRCSKASWWRSQASCLSRLLPNSCSGAAFWSVGAVEGATQT